MEYPSIVRHGLGATNVTIHQIVEALDNLFHWLVFLFSFDVIISSLVYVKITIFTQVIVQVMPHILDLALKPDEVLQAQFGGKVLWHLALPKNLIH